MSSAKEEPSTGEAPVPLESILDDIHTRLLDLTDGVYAITHMTRATFGNGSEADSARCGIHFVALKLENELQTLRERAETACERVKGSDL